jgi:hypothetical protein
MRQFPVSSVTFLSLVVGLVLPLIAQAAPPPPPCEQIVAACQGAGFVKGDAKEGFGLWRDCVDPIMRGSQQPPRADKPLPAVSPDLVAACRQLRPNFGEGHRAPPPPAAAPPPTQ